MESSPLSPKLTSRFYEVLILLRVLDQLQGEKIAGETHRDQGRAFRTPLPHQGAGRSLS